MRHEVLIRRRTGLARLDLGEVWEHRELFAFLAWRDILVRYKQTAIGVLWAFVRPLATMVALTLVFGHVARLPSDGLPYPLITFAALVPWQLFSSAFNDVSFSVVGHAHMLSKVYFPRLLIPLSSVVVSLTDFLISLGVLVLMMAWYRVPPGAGLLWLPALSLLALLAALGPGLLFAALYVEYRDVRHLIPFLLQIGLFLSPVGYSSALVPERWRLLYSLNPMATVIDGVRWGLLGAAPPHALGAGLSALMTGALFIVGLWYFKLTERRFADVI